MNSSCREITWNDRVARIDLEKLGNMDGLKEQREKEAADLSNLIQNRFRHLQNPENCDEAKILVCDLIKVCTTMLTRVYQVPPLKK